MQRPIGSSEPCRSRRSDAAAGGERIGPIRLATTFPLKGRAETQAPKLSEHIWFCGGSSAAGIRCEGVGAYSLLAPQRDEGEGTKRIRLIGGPAPHTRKGN